MPAALLPRLLALVALLPCASAGEEFDSGDPVHLYANKVSRRARLLLLGPDCSLSRQKAARLCGRPVAQLPDPACATAGWPIRKSKRGVCLLQPAVLRAERD